MKLPIRNSTVCAVIAFGWIASAYVAPVRLESAQVSVGPYVLNDSSYFEARGANVLVFSNRYGMFGDEKLAGLELIHHGVRTATNGDVRLSPTPEQWDSIPQLVSRTVDRINKRIDVVLRYASYRFEYMIRTESHGREIRVSVHLPHALPAELEGRAGFNLEFLPSAYFEKTFSMDQASGGFPLYPSGAMERSAWGTVESTPLATGRRLVLAPEDPSRRVSIASIKGTLSLYDGRNLAQNGWFVVRSIIPAHAEGTVVEWTLEASMIPHWTREPVIGYSQLGYAPRQAKTAVIEFDPNDTARHSRLRVMHVKDDGALSEVYAAAARPWGRYLRYEYCTFDFSSVNEPGTYVLCYGTHQTAPFRIAADIYASAWQPTLDLYFPVQMDHMRVTEAYRTWHGLPHLDDALQAPPNHAHFDLYAQGPKTDSPYQPFAHIPGLNVGGWFDAGDFDIRTQTQYAVVSTLVQLWEEFHPTRDETTIDQAHRFVSIHTPDGTPDLLQQIEHGALQLVAQHRAFGRAINGIVEPHLSQYRHLGDAATKTDNLIYNPDLDSLETDGRTSGTFDDRWAFTNKSTPLNYGSIAALAAASRALKGYNDTLADECLVVAGRVWDEEHTHAPDIFYYGNTTGGQLEHEELGAAVELLLTTADPRYASRVRELVPAIERTFAFNAALAVRALPMMDDAYRTKIESCARAAAVMLKSLERQNPFGVPITMGGWAGSALVVNFAITNYLLHKAFPAIIDPALTIRGLGYLYGCHPGSNLSLVSGVGTVSKKVAYGSNRADFTFIAGGVVPGVLIVKPDLPENKEDWPFLWGENEYVINVASSYMLLVHAVNDLVGNATHADMMTHSASHVGMQHREADAGIRAEIADSALTVRAGSRDLLRYHFGTVYPPSGVDPAFKRSGFIHPLWSPHGQVLTRIQPPDHYHHYGIWNPWTHVLFMGDTVDFWNLDDRKGLVRFAGSLKKLQGPDFAGYSALHEHVALTKQGEERVALREVQTVKVHAPQPNADSYLVDLTFELTCATQNPVTLLEYRYGGLGWRATEQWDRHNSEILTSEGKSRAAADGSRARWVIAQGVLGAQDHGGILLMSSPSNENHPEPLRVWPEEQNGRGDVFVNFSPTKNRSWQLVPGKTYVLQYRMCVFNGRMTAQDAEHVWQEFAACTDSMRPGVYHWDALNFGTLRGVTQTFSPVEVRGMTLHRSERLSLADTMETLIIVKDGRVSAAIGDTTRVLGEGSVVLLLPKERCSITNAHNEAASVYVMQYRSALRPDAPRGLDAGGSILVDRNNVEFKPHDKGGRRNYFERPTAMTKRFEMHVTTLNAQTKSHEPHTHAAEEMIILVSGTVEMQIGEIFYKAAAGDLLFLPSNIPHALKNIGAEPCTYFAFQFE